MAATINSTSVSHDSTSCKFILPLEQEVSAELCYTVESSGVWDCYHTEVPATHQGKGLGGILAKALFSHAQDHGIKLRLTCSYLQHYLKKHPEHADLVVV